MRTLLFALVLVATDMLTATAADNGQTGRTTGRQLVTYCQEAYAVIAGRSASHMDAGQCLGYLDAMVATHQVLEPSTGICLRGLGRAFPTYGELARLIIVASTDHPDDLDLTAWVLVTVALQQAYPCSK